MVTLDTYTATNMSWSCLNDDNCIQAATSFWYRGSVSKAEITHAAWSASPAVRTHMQKKSKKVVPNTLVPGFWILWIYSCISAILRFTKQVWFWSKNYIAGSSQEGVIMAQW